MNVIIKNGTILLILIIGIFVSGCVAAVGDATPIQETEYTHEIEKITADWSSVFDEHSYAITYFDENNVSRRKTIWATGGNGYNTTIIISNESKLTIKYPTGPLTEYIIYSDKNGLID